MILDKLFSSYGKNNSNRNDVVAVLDIGSYSVVCLIAKIGIGSKIRIIGAHRLMSSGFKEGVVTNMSALFSCIASTIYEAEQKADVTIKHIYLNVSPQACAFHKFKTKIAINDKEINKYHMDSLVLRAQEQLHLDNEPLHVSSDNYEIDGLGAIEDPVGSSGKVLGAQIQIITTQKKFVHNTINCVQRCHVQVKSLISNHLSTVLSCINEEEKKMGVIVIDCGATHTSFCVYRNNSFLYADSIDIGTADITKDIAHKFNTTYAHAERIKNLHGSVILEPKDERERVLIPTMKSKSSSIGVIDDDKVIKSEIIRIIQARFEDIANKLSTKLNNIPETQYYSIVFVGGGAKTVGLQQFMKNALKRHVRIGALEGFIGIKPDTVDLASATGMLRYIKNYTNLTVPKPNRKLFYIF